METLTAEQVATLLNVPVAMVASNERMGTLPFVRYGEGFISCHAAASAVHADRNFLAKLRDVNDKYARAQAAPFENIARDADAKRAKEKAERDAAAHAAFVERTAREAAAAKEREAAFTAQTNTRRA